MTTTDMNSTVNPYEASQGLGGTAETVQPSAPLTWFFSTVAVSLFLFTLLLNLARFASVLGIGESIFRALPTTAIYSLLGVSGYALLRPIFVQRFKLTSTPKSLIVAGLVVSAFLAMVIYFTFAPTFLSRFVASVRQSYGGPRQVEHFVYALGVLLAFPVAYLASAAERLVIGKLEPNPAPVEPIGDPLLASAETSATTQSDPNASVFWFMGTCFVVGALVSVVSSSLINDGFINGFRPVAMTVLLGGSTTTLIITFFYVAFGFLIRRTRPATVASRITAAMVFLGVCLVGNLVMDAFGIAYGLPRMAMILAAAPVSVMTDRIVAKLQAT